MPSPSFSLTPGKRVLFLTKDAEVIRRQLRGEIDLQMKDVNPDDLLDDINTDVMTPAWVCFNWQPLEIAREAYAGLIVDGARVFERDALYAGGFEVIVSGLRKGTGSSRETAAQCERWSGIKLAIAASFAPIHARNNINLGTLMSGYEVLQRLQAGESIPFEEFTDGYDPITKLIIENGGLFPFSKKLADGEITLPHHRTPPRPMTMAEKILGKKVLGASAKASDASAVAAPADGLGAASNGLPESTGSTDDLRRGARRAPVPEEPTTFVAPGDAVVVNVDGGYTHEFTTAQVHAFLTEEFGENYKIKMPSKFAVFEDHLIYADEVKAMRPHLGKIEVLRDMQREFQRHTGVQDFSAKNGISPGICHEVARVRMVEPGDFIQATDSHTCMGGANNALTWGVGATEYAGLVHAGFTQVEVPESIRFELTGKLRPGVTAKDLMLYILLAYAKPQATLNRVMEFTGPGVATLSMDERATLANMATECTARSGIVIADDRTWDWLRKWRGSSEHDIARMKANVVTPDPGAEYAGGFHTIDLSTLEPMVADPGNPDQGIASDPTNGAKVRDIGRVKIDIAYAGSCTAGKIDDLTYYHQVCLEAVEAGMKVAEGVDFIIQCGSIEVENYCREHGFFETFAKAGVRIIHPGCGACIGCGPGVSETSDQVTVSAINRNYKGRSGPGKLWLASPLTVAASAFTGYITTYEAGMFAGVGVGR